MNSLARRLSTAEFQMHANVLKKKHISKKQKPVLRTVRRPSSESMKLKSMIGGICAVVVLVMISAVYTMVGRMGKQRCHRALLDLLDKAPKVKLMLKKWKLVNAGYKYIGKYASKFKSDTKFRYVFLKPMDARCMKCLKAGQNDPCEHNGCGQLTLYFCTRTNYRICKVANKFRLREHLIVENNMKVESYHESGDRCWIRIHSGKTDMLLQTKEVRDIGKKLESDITEEESNLVDSQRENFFHSLPDIFLDWHSKKDQKYGDVEPATIKLIRPNGERTLQQAMLAEEQWRLQHPAVIPSSNDGFEEKP